MGHFSLRFDFALIAITITLIVITFLPCPCRATAIDNQTCLGCHEGLDKTLWATSHRLTESESPKTTTLACASCHNGAEAHLDNPDRETIGNPARLSGTAAHKVCTACHGAHNGEDNFGFDSHSLLEFNCSACHKIHGGSQNLLQSDRADFCLACHNEAATGFGKVSHHPVMEGNVTCLSCHRFTKRLDAGLNYQLGGVCGQCHQDKAGPFLYEHEATNAYALEGGGCSECHNPHGSEYDHLLRQPVNRLCRQCHFPAGHATAHGGIWNDYDCQLCHIDLHGSSVSRLYLDPDMAVKLGGNCFQAGCHDLNE